MGTNLLKTVNFYYKKENLLSSCASAFQELRKNENFCDIKFTVKNRTISAHRVILAAVAPQFFNEICANKPEKEEKTEIFIGNPMFADAIETLINFCYTGEIELKTAGIVNLLIYIQGHKFPDIKEACIQFMTSNLTPENVIEFKQVANHIKCQTLIDATEKFICDNFTDVVSSQHFANLQSKELLDIIGKDDLNVISEQEVYEAAMKWVKYCQAERVPVLPKLLGKIRLTLLPSDFLINVVSKEILIIQSLECRDILDEVKNEMLSKKNKTKPRKNTKEVIYVVCGSNSATQNTLRNSVIKFEDNQWTTIAKLSKEKKFFGGALMNKKLYVMTN